MAGGNVPAQLASIFQAAGHAYNIPPAILAGISSVESNLFRNNGPSSAGAIGGMQFEPATARALGVNPNDPRSAIFGAAKLLNQYGYQQNPSRAIGAYNGGPGNPQMGYAQQVMSEAARLKGELSGNPGALPQMPGSSSTLGPTPSTQAGFDQAGYQRAVAASIAGNYLKGQGKSPFSIGPRTGLDSGSGVLMSPRLLTTKAPDPAMYMHAQSSLQSIAGSAMLKPHPSVVGKLAPSTLAGGFLPAGAQYIVGRHDQGRDGQTKPGGPIVAPGDGFVVRVASDPGGFGPDYPIVHFTSGPYKGQDVYIGHTHAVLHAGQFKAGQVLSVTGTSGVGNATVPGWFEIGYAPGGNPGTFGQPTPF